MPDWPSGYSGSLVQSAGVNLATSLPTTVTSGAANTKGAWQEIEASLPHSADGFLVNVIEGATVRQSFLLDVGIGAASSEVVVLENLMFSADTAGVVGRSYNIPLPIAVGSRVSIRIQARSGSSQTLTCSLGFVSGGFYSSMRCGRATTYGANTADTGGVAPDPDNTAHTKGAWAEISSGIEHAASALLVCVSNFGTNLSTTSREVFDIGIGAGGSEVVLLPDLAMVFNAGNDRCEPIAFGPLGCSVKAGTRMAVRSQTSVAGSGTRYDVSVIGFD